MEKSYIWTVIAAILVISLTMGVQVAYAVDLDGDISAEDKKTFDKMLAPVMKVYGFIKYSATAIAAIALMIAGIIYMTSGSDVRKRDQSKSMVGYVIAGIAVIWATPYIVNFLIA